MKLSEIVSKTYEYPQELFCDLWDTATSYTTYQRTTAVVSETLLVKLIEAFELDDERQATHSSLSVISTHLRIAPQEECGATMAFLRALDDIFLRIHPRAQNNVRKISGPVVPGWLRRAELRRLRTGTYWQVDGRVVIPRGPLLRVNRKQFAAGGETIEDYFSALTLASTKILLNHRRVEVRNLVVPIGGRLGVSVKKGAENSIVFVPVAVHPTELILKSEIIGNQGFVSSNSTVDAATIIEDVLTAESEIDLLIAPEMTVDESAVERVSKVIQGAAKAPRLTIAGTGNTFAVDADGLSWNESAAINEFGNFLWRQRKMWTSGFSNERVQLYGLPESPSGFYLEKNAESNEIVIADIDGYGRCCILICQDLQAKPLAVEMLKSFQPDWVFCPILDPGIRNGGWAHQRAFDLSSDSNARFVISSSLSLVANPTDPLPAIGLAIGPKASILQENDKGRTFAEIRLEFPIASNYGKITWGSKDWSQTKIGSTDIGIVPAVIGKSKLH